MERERARVDPRTLDERNDHRAPERRSRAERGRHRARRELVAERAVVVLRALLVAGDERGTARRFVRARGVARLRVLVCMRVRVREHGTASMLRVRRGCVFEFAVLRADAVANEHEVCRRRELAGDEEHQRERDAEE